MVEGARLESVYTSKGYRGFESRSLRGKNRKSLGTNTHKLRRVYEEITNVQFDVVPPIRSSARIDGANA